MATRCFYIGNMDTLKPPLIGIPMYPTRVDDADSPSQMSGLRSYAERLVEAGALPVFLPLAALPILDRYLDRLQGVLLPGGCDIDPALFGEEPHPNLKVVSSPRDEFEIALFRAAVERDTPVLGICRGIQVMNVALGGSLIQDIPAQTTSTVDHRSDDETELRHEVEVPEGSLLAAAIGPGVHAVNSQHHQAVKDPAPGLTVTSVCPADGVIEAVELPGKAFVVGVQFHPECLPDRFSALFFGFVSACSQRD
ncbi:MAG TPA: gamma-glutamyl-gamma-aminobutyrate hydrolase family protein [Armatimonadota bacterium]